MGRFKVPLLQLLRLDSRDLLVAAGPPCLRQMRASRSAPVVHKHVAQRA
jgi:hypothetical protein